MMLYTVRHQQGATSRKKFGKDILRKLALSTRCD